MKKTFNVNEKIGLFEEIIFDHIYDLETNKIIRTNIPPLILILVILIIVSILLALA